MGQGGVKVWGRVPSPPEGQRLQGLRGHRKPHLEVLKHTAFLFQREQGCWNSEGSRGIAIKVPFDGLLPLSIIRPFRNVRWTGFAMRDRRPAMNCVAVR